MGLIGIARLWGLVVLALFPSVAAAQDDLVFDTQLALARVGCLAGNPDGRWGPASRAALEAFGSAIDEDLGSEPSAEALKWLQETFGSVCGVASAAAPSDPREAETLPSEPSEAPAPVAEPPAEPARATPACISATVEVGAKPGYGDRWDFPKRDPDVVIREQTTGMTNTCKDSYSCQLRIVPTGDHLAFDIVDDDGMSKDDAIGSGQCPLDGICTLPPAATITLGSC